MNNPFELYPHKRQPRKRYRRQSNSVQPVIDGMVTLGSIAVIGGVTGAVIQSMQK